MSARFLVRADLIGPLCSMRGVTHAEGAIAEELLACKIIIDVKVIYWGDLLQFRLRSRRPSN